MIDRQRWIYFVAIIVLFVSGFYMQAHLYLSPDVTWLLYTTGEILSGKHYGIDIFETNPPMILWLSTPAVLLQRILHIDIHWIFLIYIYALTLLSLSLCFVLLDRAHPKSNDKVSDWALKLTLTAGVLFLPLYAFGQRDVVWLMLILPWLGAAVCRVNHQPVRRWEALVSGLMAGLGFALKPYFLCVLCLVELYVMFDSRRLFGWWRIETAIILAVFFLYLTAIAMKQPGYFDTVLPLVMRYYFIAAIQPWSVILTVPWFLFSSSVAIYYVLFRSFDRHPAQGNVLFLVLVGTILSFLLARTPWYYHACPALIMGCVLLVYITVQMIQQGVGGWGSLYNVLIPATMAGLMLYFPVSVLIIDMPNNKNAFQTLAAVAEIIQSGKKNDMTVNAMSIHSTGETIVSADLAGAKFVSGMPFFWWYDGLLSSELMRLQSGEQLIKDRKFLTDITSREIAQAKPQWVVTSGEGEHFFNDIIYKRHTIGWLRNMMLNDRLRAAFQCYRLYALSDKYRIYERVEHCV